MATNFDLALAIAVALLVGYFGYRFLFGSSEEETDSFTSAMNASAAEKGDSRNIVSRMKESGKNLVVFYGSQTGTAEDCASKLAKDLSVRFGFKAMVADLENYDYESLDQFPEENIAIFCLASYGEGEPTDNAVDFWTFINDDEPEFSGEGNKLASMHFAVFGLGSSTYENFNEVGRVTNQRLKTLGATPITPYGEADDANETTEEDFLAWKEQLFNSLKTERGLEEKEYEYEPAIELVEHVDMTIEDNSVYLGEANKNLLAGINKSPYHHTNPFLAPVKLTKQLMQNTDRKCVHLEFDLTDSGLRYTTGDHLAFWPQNSDREVDRFLDAFGLTQQRDEVISFKILDPTVKIPFPYPTTYDTTVRYNLEINGPVSRQVLSNISSFAPTDAIKHKVKTLSNDKELFQEEVSKPGYNLAGIMLKLSGGKSWDVPFTFVVESLPHLQVRYYSISSSSGEDPSTLSITAVLERSERGDVELRGVATNYIYNIHEALHESATFKREYNLEGPRGSFGHVPNLKVPVHVRRSNFKLPSRSETPIIMVGPGTGVAPFRGFVHERATQQKKGKTIGKSVLFFGCRSANQDALYGNEWSQYDFLQVINAFSRDEAEKVYVQHRMLENAALINELLEKGAYFYICGDASNMARSVHATLGQIIQKQRGVSLEDAELVIKKMKARNFYQEDVW